MQDGAFWPGCEIWKGGPCVSQGTVFCLAGFLDRFAAPFAVDPVLAAAPVVRAADDAAKLGLA